MSQILIDHSWMEENSRRHTARKQNPMPLDSLSKCYISDHENYFWRAGQNVRQAFSTLPDILSSCQTFSQLMTSKYQWSSVGHFMCIDPCQTKCPARSELFAGRQQKSAGHVQHISQSLLHTEGWFSKITDHLLLRGHPRVWMAHSCRNSYPYSPLIKLRLGYCIHVPMAGYGHWWGWASFVSYPKMMRMMHYPTGPWVNGWLWPMI